MTPLPRRVRRAAARARTGAWSTRCDGNTVVAVACVRARYHCSKCSALPARVALAIGAALGGYRG